MSDVVQRAAGRKWARRVGNAGVKLVVWLHRATLRTFNEIKEGFKRGIEWLLGVGF